MKKITKSEAFEFLSNRKIFAGNKEISSRVQKQLFRAGYKWNGNGAEIVYDTYPFLYTDSDKITFGISIDFYKKSEKEEISAIEIINWDIIDDKPVFKTGDEVLMRSSERNKWAYCIYSHFDTSYNGHVAAGGTYFKDCIPYNGNESLVGTSKEPTTIN